MINRPDFDELFGGRFLKATDLDADPAKTEVVTIKNTDLQQIGPDKQSKMLLEFQEIEKPLVLNKTNATTIADLYGKNFSEWIGKRIGLYVQDVSFQGKTTLGVRVRTRAPKNQAVEEAKSEDDY